MEKKTYLKLKKVAFTIFTFAFLATTPFFAHAATLYFSPSSGTHAVGTIFSVSVYVSSAEQAMNAASGVISFPQDKLEVTALSKSDSIFTLWVQEPSFSNSSGAVNFEGIVLNPGFTGSTGKILTINFRTKTSGIAPINFSSGSALANDGKGTNILASLGNAQFSLGGAASPATESIAPASSYVPNAPKIVSSTHPDSEKWYKESTAKFSWESPSGITGARLLIDNRPDTVPTITYTSPINSKTVDDLEDGVWYFHARLRNSAGWGKAAHMKVQIDTVAPDSFSISEVSSENKTTPIVSFLFNATDKLSGIDHYEVSFDNGTSQLWKDDGKHLFVTPTMTAGSHTIIARAFDKAGNSVEKQEAFIIERLLPPKIIEYPRSLVVGESVIIKGTIDYPNSEVAVWFEGSNADEVFVNNQANVNTKTHLDRHSHIMRADKTGAFILEHEKIDNAGIYTVFAQVTDDQSAKSEPSEKIIIKVNQKGTQFFSEVGASGIFILMLLLIIAWYIRSTFILLQNNLHKEVNEARQALEKAFKLLREEVEEHIKEIEKAKENRVLTKEEEKALKRFKKNLNEAEKFVKKEMDDIEDVWG